MLWHCLCAAFVLDTGGTLAHRVSFRARSPPMTIFPFPSAELHPRSVPNNPQIMWPRELGIWTHSPQVGVAIGVGDTACIEQSFAHLWHRGLMRNIWRGDPDKLHQSGVFCCISRNFAFRGRCVTPPYGRWDHVPPPVWSNANDSAATKDAGQNEAEVCALCCHSRSTIAVCSLCNEHYCHERIDPHICGDNTVSNMTHQFVPCSLLSSRDGLQFILLCLGGGVRGFSRGGLTLGWLIQK